MHIPVMLDEVLEALALHKGQVVVDGTLGLAGHAREIVKRIRPMGKLIGLDCDPEALAQARLRLTPYLDHCVLVHQNYARIHEVLGSLKIDKVNGILLDLGVSSFQLDQATRGFSLKNNGPLDMRMDPSQGQSAFDLVNALPEKELSAIFKNWGEERWHARIARQIVRQRATTPLETTEDLKRAVMKAIPPRRNWQKRHPATRTFQALRIAVNNELDNVAKGLDQCVAALAEGGRIVVIAFHSLEDRIVKNKFRDEKKAGRLRLLTKKPLRPQDQEAQQNTRARSARLRIAERM